MSARSDDVDWPALSGDEVAAALDVGLGGLSAPEVDRQRQRFGRNSLPEPPRRSAFRRFMAQFNNTLVYFLIVGAVAAAILGHVIDAVVIIAVVIINAVIGYVQEGKAEEALKAIQQMIAPKASVVREDVRQTIDVEDLVPGDLVLLEAGDRVPADIRLLQARGLLADESILSGESVAAEKNSEVLEAGTDLADRQNMVFSGTMVVAGQGSGIVVETGAASQIGRINALIQSVDVTATPLLRQIDQFARRFTWAVVAGGVLLFAFAVIVRHYDWVDALIAVVALAVGIVPEGLPAVITITLAVGVRRMAARNAVIRQLPAVETLGATSVICSDKTGTLTRNEMMARRIVSAGHLLLADGAGYAPEGEVRPAGPGDAREAMDEALPLIRCGVLCNNASLRKEGEHWRVAGDPMEGALSALAMKAGMDPDAERGTWERLDEIPFDAAYRFMATLCRSPLGELVIFVKGAPEAILQMSSAVDRDQWDRAIHDAAADGERVLGFGMKPVAAGTEGIGLDQLRDGVQFLGLVGFIDPPRQEARNAIAECHSAGIDVKMITGDHAVTALAIARQLGLAGDARAITGAELEKLSDEDLRVVAGDVSVFARTSPEHKIRIVRALQARGNTVAMTGDGVNDAPSLKQADVGVAMGIKGTEASKEAASMVLLDDNFASIVSAVREGRTVYDNIRKVISWEIPTNGGETLAVITAIFLGFALPMTATQILWMNLVPAVTLGIVLAFEPTEPDTMKRPPRPHDAPLLTPFLLWRIVLMSVLLAIVTLAIFFYALGQGRSLETARTMVVNMFVVAEMFYLFNVRFLYASSISWRGALGTPALLGAIALLIIAQAVFTYAPFMNDIFGSRPLYLSDLVLLVVVGVTLMILLEIEKSLLRRLGWFEDLGP